MKTAEKYRIVVIIVTLLVFIAAFVMLIGWLRDLSNFEFPSLLHKPEATVDPHEGQVYIDDGFGMVWMTPLEGVEVNPFNKHDFSMASGKIDYIGKDYTTMRGVDVSEHQHEIDWQKVRGAGYDFAFIRVAYRGYTKGGLFMDAFAETNLKGAAQAGLKVGVYFFSQAITPEEAAEEAEYLLDAIKGYDVDFPVVYDWEPMTDYGDARTNGLDGEIITQCAIAFCDTVKAAGYDPCIYFNRHLGYYRYDLSKLTDYKFWVSVPGEYPDFYYAADIWQYSFTETVPGIPYENDVNLMFFPVVKETPPPASN